MPELPLISAVSDIGYGARGRHRWKRTRDRRRRDERDAVGGDRERAVGDRVADGRGERRVGIAGRLGGHDDRAGRLPCSLSVHLLDARGTRQRARGRRDVGDSRIRRRDPDLLAGHTAAVPQRQHDVVGAALRDRPQRRLPRSRSCRPCSRRVRVSVSSKQPERAACDADRPMVIRDAAIERICMLSSPHCEANASALWFLNVTACRRAAPAGSSCEACVRCYVRVAVTLAVEIGTGVHRCFPPCKA